MNTEHSIQGVRAQIQRARSQGKRVALVPTMGNLHAGHIQLVNTAHQWADLVVVSIFVNPLQFGAHEDLEAYPRTLEADQVQLVDANCHLLFVPSVQEMYPQGMQDHTQVQVAGVSQGLCGQSRPTHFAGVATVVSKLLNIVQPDVALFGEKDYQQLAVIRKLVADLNMPIEILGVPTVRDTDGLALSSRNGYLSPQERAQAPELYQALQQVAQTLKAGAEIDQALQVGQHALRTWRLDYLEVRQALTLAPAQATDTELVILAAAYLGNTRLIDNLQVTLIPA
ncbi:pantoate--beta-alanine ligase [Allopseudospirillum japonicum]|uniref:Pantothenate synthetase n=1 Tax=Allopseudospirillum japonicum TaxID=64971 RepID=A0A1H6SGF7_9GAMM|nr:pantoate--beta-alanine ligase [Allopseudospirillum japonicum]SEI67013.1 pantoate--beta-alanine ligase [Allopseudospirillum japonicum]